MSGSTVETRHRRALREAESEGERDSSRRLAEYLKLVQLEKEFEEEEPKEIKVTWVEPDRHQEPRNNVRPAAVAAEVSRIDEHGSRVFGADRQRKEPGAVPGSDPAELSESGADWG